MSKIFTVLREGQMGGNWKWNAGMVREAFKMKSGDTWEKFSTGRQDFQYQQRMGHDYTHNILKMLRKQ